MRPNNISALTDRRDYIIYGAAALTIGVLTDQVEVFISLLLGFFLGKLQWDIVLTAGFAALVGGTIAYFGITQTSPLFYWLPFLSFVALPGVILSGIAFALSALLGYLIGLVI